MNAANECVPFSIGLVAGHEYESFTQMGLNPLNRHVEFVPGKSWHDHIAQDRVEIRNHDLLQTIDTIVYPDHSARVLFDEFLQCHCEFVILFQQPNRAFSGFGEVPSLGSYGVALVAVKSFHLVILSQVSYSTHKQGPCRL